jgi:RNA polymerase sigma-70 factor (ECF subfamily)
MKKDGGDIDIKLTWDKMKSGDEQSLSEIFTFLYSDLYHYGIKILNLPGPVKDAIQDVFVHIWERRGTIGDVKNPKAYLISSLRRKLFENKDKYLKEVLGERMVDGMEAFSFSAIEVSEAEEMSQQLRHSLIQAINSLPERQRELIFLRFYYNLRYLEIARMMEVKEQTIKNMMQRAISNLRGKIDRPEGSGWEGIDNMDDLMMTLFLLFGKKYVNN